MENNKLVYIASPYSGDTERNAEFARAACRHCIEQGHTPIAAHLLYSQLLDDSIPQEREVGLSLGRNILAVCDEVWVCGNRVSNGMILEIEDAVRLGKPVLNIDAEHILGNLAVKLNVIPEFNPDRYEVRNRVYGNTGGYCMVATLEVYLPDVNKTVWVNCNDECVTITAMDYIWNEDGSDSWDKYDFDDVVIYAASLESDVPDDAITWYPIIIEALLYTIEMETSHFKGNPFSLPVSWLPQSIRKDTAPEYLDWLQKQGKMADIVEGTIEIDSAYLSHNQPLVDNSAMEVC